MPAARGKRPQTPHPPPLQPEFLTCRKHKVVGNCYAHAGLFRGPRVFLGATHATHEDTATPMLILNTPGFFFLSGFSDHSARVRCFMGAKAPRAAASGCSGSGLGLKTAAERCGGSTPRYPFFLFENELPVVWSILLRNLGVSWYFFLTHIHLNMLRIPRGDGATLERPVVGRWTSTTR